VNNQGMVDERNLLAPVDIVVQGGSNMTGTICV
jgi:hypothetical protein